MTDADPQTDCNTHRGMLWTGRVISGIVGALFVMAAAGKLVGGEMLDEGFTKLGLPLAMATPLAILQLTCAVIYLIPQTAVLGAILLAG